MTGTATITTTVTDGDSLTDDATFVLTVEPFCIYLSPVTKNS